MVILVKVLPQKWGGCATPFHDSVRELELLYMPYECIIGIQPEEAGHASSSRDNGMCGIQCLRYDL